MASSTENKVVDGGKTPSFRKAADAHFDSLVDLMRKKEAYPMQQRIPHVPVNGANRVKSNNGVNGSNGANGANSVNGVDRDIGANRFSVVKEVKGANGVNGVNGICTKSRFSLDRADNLRQDDIEHLPQSEVSLIMLDDLLHVETRPNHSPIQNTSATEDLAILAAGPRDRLPSDQSFDHASTDQDDSNSLKRMEVNILGMVSQMLRPKPIDEPLRGVTNPGFYNLARHAPQDQTVVKRNTELSEVNGFGHKDAIMDIGKDMERLESKSRSPNGVEAVNGLTVVNARARLEQTQINMDTQTERVKNLLDTLKSREKLYKEMEEKLKDTENKVKEAKTEAGYLKAQLREAQKTDTPSALDKFATFEAQIKQKNSEIGRLREAQRKADKVLQNKQAQIEKTSNELTALRGAAHLVAPSSKKQLPRGVFSCIECFVHNADCDLKAICSNCREEGKKCLRWRCSLVHRFGQCPEGHMCPMKHDPEGWLYAQKDRPQW
ncbi:hypothetical protein BU24DRAFT_452723 [Aaosphaeria arxii CBS 175.79]|uniref:C3H1-type domain-containing protein n=1 Tax=Aaosphaeria arxii CBS 175.79 TaxID=1450172 RepID=A0A6A5XM28_9PLEO|nr:uncharacterized protein BU24DRAFT_452723 [Aaosphaeria arxii CBS 175.79]KAF2013929.1 hypothetical protein BU24DRAFT_452723 [Aaosphaeria arxii CBS 175.79]